jgi:hypothetical protein
VTAASRGCDLSIRSVAASFQRVDVLLQGVDLLLQRVDVLLQKVDAALQRVDVLLQKVDALLRRVDALLRSVDALEQNRPVIRTFRAFLPRSERENAISLAGAQRRRVIGRRRAARLPAEPALLLAEIRAAGLDQFRQLGLH